MLSISKGARLGLVILFAALLGACGGPVAPGDRELLPRDYEPPPIDGFPSTEPPSRI